MYCSPRSDAGRKMESCIHWEQLVRRISVLPSLRIMTGAPEAPRHEINIRVLFLCDSRSLQGVAIIFSVALGWWL